MPWHGPFLSQVPSLESVTDSWHLLHAHCLPLLDSLWSVLESSLILDLKCASLAFLGALTFGPRVAHTAKLIVTSLSCTCDVSLSRSATSSTIRCGTWHPVAASVARRSAAWLAT